MLLAKIYQFLLYFFFGIRIGFVWENIKDRRNICRKTGLVAHKSALKKKRVNVVYVFVLMLRPLDTRLLVNYNYRFSISLLAYEMVHNVFNTNE